MIEDRMKNAMQSKLPEVPEGFDARISKQIVELTAEPERRTGLRAGWVAALVMVLVLGIATALAATNERVNAWLYEFWPEAAATLMPADTSCEKEGIRLELVSASVDDGMLNMVFSLEDVEGDRINENTEVDATIEWEGVESRYDAEQKKMLLTWSTEYEYHKEPENGAYELEIAILKNHRTIHVDLLPYLKKYGSQGSLIPVREEDMDAEDPIASSERVLDYTDSQDIPLSDYVMLSGIGVEDGVLRVQFHYPVHHREFVRIFKDTEDPQDQDEGPYRTYSYSPYQCDAYLYEAEERHEELPMAEDIAGPLPLSWGKGQEKAEEVPEWDANVSQAEWEEFHYSVGSGLTDTQKLTAEIREEEPPIIGLWTVKVPPRLIKNNQ